MLVFPNCKINLGLHVTSKRADGYHNIETVFYPVNWCDALEVIVNTTAGAQPFSWSQTGLPVAGDMSDNLVYKAWQLIVETYSLPPVSVHLHKTLPMGAGLGGGSADAAFFINLVNEKFELGMTESRRLELATRLGSDCAFFIRNRPTFATGRGDEFSEVHVDLSSFYILLVYPAIHSNTRDAYAGLTPAAPAQPLHTVLQGPVDTWRNTLINDFESSIFGKYPVIAGLKQELYAKGAVYASLSGSGSSVFGIFREAPQLSFPKGWLSFVQNPAASRL